MSNDKSIQENIDLYSYFTIEYSFKDKDFKKGLESTLVEINSMKLLRFKPKLELKSTILENFFPELKTRLTFSFENYEIKINKDNIKISYPKGLDVLIPEFKFYPRLFSRVESLKAETGEYKISIEELKQIDEIIKLYLMQKLVEFKEPISLTSIDIFSIINPIKEIDFNFLNQTISNQIKSDNPYTISNIDLTIEKTKNTHKIYLDEKLKKIIFLSTLESNINWTIPLIDLLNNNINQLKEIWGELKL